MPRRYSSIGLFGVFGRSGDLRQFDAALRAVDLHPRLVPEAVKLTAVALLKDVAGHEPAPEAYRAAADIVAYCMVGAEAFAAATDEQRRHDVEQRIEAALESGDSFDAKLILLTVHAKVIQPSVVAQFQIESARGE